MSCCKWTVCIPLVTLLATHFCFRENVVSFSFKKFHLPQNFHNEVTIIHYNFCQSTFTASNFRGAGTPSKINFKKRSGHFLPTSLDSTFTIVLTRKKKSRTLHLSVKKFASKTGNHIWVAKVKIFSLTSSYIGLCF